MSEEKDEKSRIPLYASLGILLLLILSYFLIPSVQQFLDRSWEVLTSDDQERIQNWVDGFGVFGPLVLIFAMVAQMFLLVIPTILLMVVAILAYGPVWGSLIVFIAVFCASSVGYFLGRYLTEGHVAKIIGRKSERKVSQFIEDYGFWAVVITRINPFLSNDAISFVAGILKMGYWRFMAATLVGIAPLVLFIAIIGKSTGSLKVGLLWGSLISLAIFLLYVWWDKRRKKDH